ncbi:cytochrome c family protein [bacterium]|nr:cytochrome c family protein [bacterium]
MKAMTQAILARWRILFLVLVLAIAGAIQALTLRNNKGYEPTQPIAFSHKLHAGKLGMDCLYCHSNADKSAHATIPAVDACMGCHSVVRTDRPEIQKLTKYFEDGKPVPWDRIHRVPDHVHFSHKAHVAAGVACQTCHGPVETMETLRQFAPLNMGWCVSCHRNDDYLRTGAKQDAWEAEGLEIAGEETEFKSLKSNMWDGRELDQLASKAKTDEEAAAELKTQILAALGYDSLAPQAGPGAIDHVKAFQNASIDCNTCHQ